MSKWTHPICNECDVKKYPGREPHKLVDPTEEKCCFCGELTVSGIYVRHDPTHLFCKGDHGDE